MYNEDDLRTLKSSILTSNEIDSIRKTSSNYKDLEQIFENIIKKIKETSDLLSPFKTLLRERLYSRINYMSIYREILFLVLVALERELIDLDSFDTEYRSTYKTLLKSISNNENILNSDRPPNNVAVWCRRLFSPLNL